MNHKKLLLLSFTLLTSAQISAGAGDLDETFGPFGPGAFPGTVITAIGGSTDARIRSVALQPKDEKIVAGGYATIGGNSVLAITRYNTDGSLDTSFDGNGLVTANFVGATSSRVRSVVIQPDGKILVGGRAVVAGEKRYALARFNANGDVDTSFGTGGGTTTDFGTSTTPDSEIASIALQEDGKILAAGDIRVDVGLQSIPRFGLARYSQIGVLDTTFGTNGFVTTDFGTNPAQARSMAVEPCGNIILGGHVTTGGVTNFALARYDANGSLVTSFGNNGTVITPIGTLDQIRSVAIHLDGKIVVCGWATIGGVINLVLARYNPEDGSLDSTFNPNGTTPGIVTRVIGSAAVKMTLAIQADGKIIAGGSATFPGGDRFTMARFKPDGSLDEEFNPNGTTPGIVTTMIGTAAIVRSIAIQEDNKIVAGGAATINGINEFALARYDAGVVNVTFSNLIRAKYADRVCC